MNARLRICYFAPLESIHTIRWLDHFSGRGHEIYAYTGISTGFVKWTAGNHLLAKHGGDPHIKLFDNPKLIRQFTNPLNRISALREPLNLLRKKLNLVKKKRRLHYQSSEVKPDIVHALWLGDDSFDAWLTGIRPMLVTVWGSDIRKIATKPLATQSRLRIVLSNADAVTSDSDELLELCQSWGAKVDRCHRIGVPGIDVENFSKAPKTDLLKRLGILDGTQIILSCRATTPLYQIHNIVTAFQYVHQRCPETTLLILNYNTDNEYLRIVEEQIRKSGLKQSIILVGSMPYEQMPELYASSSVMVSIPEADGMPQSAYEALAAGCPIVASDLSTYDGIIDNEYTGLRVNGDDAQEIAMAILRLLQDDSLRERLISNGRQVVKNRGDIRREMTKMEQLYYDLLMQA